MKSRLIYIAGQGRAGSTVVERVLHSAPGVAALGEFHVLWRLELDAITCACGRRVADDPFWTEVLASSGLGAQGLRELRALEVLIARVPFVSEHGYDLERLRRDEQVRRYLALQTRILDAVADHTGASVLVDSSKAGPKAWMMATDPRASVVYIYRKPADVMLSWRTRKFDAAIGREMRRIPPGLIALARIKNEVVIRKLARQTGVGFLHYDDFVAAPREALAAALPADLRHLAAKAAWVDERTFVPGDDYHSLSGNPDRFDARPITISRRSSRPTGVTWLDRVSSSAFGGAVGLLYPFPARRAAHGRVSGTR